MIKRWYPCPGQNFTRLLIHPLIGSLRKLIVHPQHQSSAFDTETINYKNETTSSNGFHIKNSLLVKWNVCLQGNVSPIMFSKIVFNRKENSDNQVTDSIHHLSAFLIYLSTHLKIHSKYLLSYKSLFFKDHFIFTESYHPSEYVINKQNSWTKKL